MEERKAGGILDVLKKERWRETEAQAVVDAWERSGKSLSGFAREHGLDRNRLSRWRCRLGTGGAVRFHPARLVEGRWEGERVDTIEVVLLDGRRVRVGAGFATEDLERVLSVLEDRA